MGNKEILNLCILLDGRWATGRVEGIFRWLLKISLDLFQSSNSAILMGGLAGEFEEWRLLLPCECLK